MKIKFLGSGSAFCNKEHNWQSNILIEHNGKKLLFDCGGDIRHSLSDYGLSSLDIDAIYISHQHADHAGGLEYMAFTTYFNPEAQKIKLFGYEPMLNDLWNETLMGTLKQTAPFYEFFVIPRLKLSSRPYYINRFEWEGIGFRLIYNEHCPGEMCSYGLIFDAPNGQRVYISGDSVLRKDNYIYDQADIIFHDCETMYKSGVHAHYDELRELPETIKQKMFLYHFQDNVVIDYNTWNEKQWSDGFKGFMYRGDEINF